MDDLEAVIKKLGLRRFHLYGQSFGGILAYEYLKRVAERKGSGECLSVIFSSAPFSVKVVEASANQLLDILKEEDDDEETLGERFRLAHQCRLEAMPAPLIDAYAHAGKTWRGTSAIPDYEAKPPSDSAARMPSALLMRGEVKSRNILIDKCDISCRVRCIVVYLLKLVSTRFDSHSSFDTMFM